MHIYTHMDVLLVFTYARPVVSVSPSAALLSLLSPVSLALCPFPKPAVALAMGFV